MTDALRLRYFPDTDETGELLASVCSNGFSGSSVAWFRKSALVELAQKLAAAFPLASDPKLEISGGFLDKSATSLIQVHVGLSFYPVGSAGKVGCRVVLSSPLYEHGRPDEQSSLRVELTTTYEYLSSFARDLELLANGALDEAVLSGAR